VTNADTFVERFLKTAKRVPPTVDNLREGGENSAMLETREAPREFTLWRRPSRV
jgi:hypothetical protein